MGIALMSFTIPEILILLFVVGGATKGLAYFLKAGQSQTRAERYSSVTTALIVQAVVLATFAAFGTEIMKFFHVSVGAIAVAGGLILLIFAIGLVLGEEHAEEPGKPAADYAIYPLAVPLLATPQAIVATIIIFSTAPDTAAKTNAWIALAILLVINVAILFGAARLMRPGGEGASKSGGIAGVLLRIVAIMLSALAVELIVRGLRELGIIAAAVSAAH